VSEDPDLYLAVAALDERAQGLHAWEIAWSLSLSLLSISSERAQGLHAWEIAPHEASVPLT